MDGATEFRYDISRAGRVMMALVLGLAALLWVQHVFLDLGGNDPDAFIGVLIVMLVVSGVLLPVPAMELLWWARGRVAVSTVGLSWRGWAGWNTREWGEILGVGVPPEASGDRADDQRLHVVTDDGYEFIHGYCLREREALRDALRSHGGLDEVEAVGRHQFLCRPGATRLVRERAREHIDLSGDDLTDFWAGRFRRF
ncbi:MAG: hypothetical protein ACOX9R_16660 [Armatimonadota bacterium]|jgi:hypothetical protein